MTADKSAVTPPARLFVLGANGPTGHRVIRLALQRGYQIHALTRHPENFPIQDDHLQVVAGDATDADTIDAAVAATDAVICTIGASFTLKPVTVYSITTKHLVTAMLKRKRKRIVLVTSEGVDESADRGGLAQRASYTLMRRVFGRTVYDDMTQMEALIWGTDLDWTIVRPPGLTNEAGHGYVTAENFVDGAFCARDDLAVMLLDQLDDTRYVKKVAAVATPGLHVSPATMFRQEILKR